VTGVVSTGLDRRIERLLIANRGEIACRIIRTARAMGIHTVAVHSDLDRTAPHVVAADEAVEIGSYLDIEAVVAAAVARGVDAIHPGYGFLSERAAFAQAVEDAGLTLVGPSAAVMELMGRKDAAREVAEKAGVPVVPSYDMSADAHTFDYPVLVKAAAGGGGKGMRVVTQVEDYAEAVEAARREARSAFGDDTMLVEKYVESGRHVEVQVIGDGHGHVLHLFERDCSTQRRHQKVLEESPAPTITPEQRERVTSAAVALASEVGYVNAGTVEFLLDTQPEKGGTGEFYFLEMNTRLQVEHPVTELVTGVDLVELQLRVAAGEELPLTQDDLHLDGHAIEARVYAEDSFAGFLPQAGTASLVRWPLGRSSGVEIRVDHALESGQVVSTAYDPMLGKIIVHGPDRESARRGLLAALDDTAVLGFTTNVGYLRVLVASAEFRDATIDTAWLDRAEVPPPSDDLPRTIAAWVPAMLAPESAPHDPFQADGFRVGADPAPTRVELDRVVLVDRAIGTVDGVPVTQLHAAHHVVRLDVDGRRVQAVVNATAHFVEVVFEGQRFVFERPDAFAAHGPAAGEGSLTAPMPGTVLAVDVTEDDRVEEGQRLGVLEAMKMEITLRAPFAGTVTTVGAVAGEQVKLGVVLFEVEATPDD
jgi:acetyl-CoA/propionyl-CoA carboxylase, biotin carboxylase, biotin carboxyl carrier protein